MFPCSCPAFTHHSFSPFLILLLSAPLLSLYLNITHLFIISLSVVAEIGDYGSSLQPWMCMCAGVLWRTRGWSQFPALSWVSPETNTTSITTLCSIIVLIATSQSRRQCVCVEACQWDVNWAVKGVYCVCWLYSSASMFLFDLSTPPFRSATSN